MGDYGSDNKHVKLADLATAAKATVRFVMDWCGSAN